MNSTTKTNFMRVTAALLLGISMAAQATRTDDTEIYLDSGNAFASDPIVMFYIEYTSRLAGQNACENLVDISNTTTTGLKAAMDVNCTNLATIKEFLVYPDSPGGSLYNYDLMDKKIDRFELLRAAVKRVVMGLGKMKVGVLGVHGDDTASDACSGPLASGCSNGAYILHRAVSLLDVDTILTNAGLTGPFDYRLASHRDAVMNADANKRALFQKLNGLPTPQGTLSHEHQDKEVAFELFRYLTGKPVYNGRNGWSDYGTTSTNNLGALTAVNNTGAYDCAPGYTCTTSGDGVFVDALTRVNGKPAGAYDGDMVLPTLGSTAYISSARLKRDTNAESDGLYISPITEHCQRIFAINAVYGSGNKANDSNSAIGLPFSTHGMNMTITTTDAGYVDMIRTLRDYDLANGTINPNLNFIDKQNVTTFYLADQTQQVDAAAEAGGTGRAIQLTSNPETLVNELQKVLNQILSVSTTFVAASIPVNVFNRSEVIDNAYIALFQADANSRPAWMGDIKKLKLDIYVQTNPDGSTTNKLQFIDAPGTDAIALDGRINSFALTYWTNGSGYDITDPTNVTGEDPPIVTGKDGRAVTRGGAGQQIPGFLNGNARGTVSWLNSSTGRRLFTEATSTAEESDYLAAGSKLMDIEYNNAAYLWTSIYDHNDPVIRSQWPTLLDTSYKGTYSLSSISSDAYVPWDSACYSYYDSTTAASSSNWTQPNCFVYDTVSNIFAFMRGYDVRSTVHTNREMTGRWLLGDPLHSRPLPINYGKQSGYSDANQDIRILVGNNDGYLRMIRNTKPVSCGTRTVNGETKAGLDCEEGKEVWAFMPREVMKIQKQLMDNQVVGASSTWPKHTYGVDGSPVAYIRDADGTIGTCTNASGVTVTPCDDIAMVYFGLRRGGRAYYALNITNPDAPKFVKKITPLSTGFSELGYTFSQPVVRYMNWGAGVKPVLIFAGGYDLDKDITGQGTNDDMGRAIYIVNAETLDLVWKAQYHATSTGYESSTYTYNTTAMVDSIPAEVTATDGNGDGLVDRIYVGDTGGKVWRVDMPGQKASSTDTNYLTDSRANWSAAVLMNMGRHWNADSTATGGNYPNDRRFFSAIDVVPTRDANSVNYDALLIGSGNREHPLGTINTDYMFMYRDYCITQTLTQCNASGFTPITPDDLYDVTNNCLQNGTCTISGLSAAESTDFNRGWKLQLTAAGEKSLSAPLTLRGVVYFNTYVPTTTLIPVADDPLTDIDESAQTCKPEGKGYFYAVSVADATAVFDYFSTLNESATVTLTTEDRKRELASGGIPAENVYVSYREGELSYTGILPPDLDATPDLGASQWRSFWYEKQR